MHRRWVVKRTNQDYLKYLSKNASISTVLAQILVNRGIKTVGEINAFLYPNISQLSDPFDIEGMEIAIGRIKRALERNEKVLVHGDYDVDGITATSIILKVLNMIGIDAFYFIPNRLKHGYGFNNEAVEKAKQIGASLIITVDCGISSYETVAECKKEGIDVIITDHHEPIVNSDSVVKYNDLVVRSGDFLLPKAFAIINPKISRVPSSISNLSGAGIAFKLAQALAIHYSRFEIQDFIDLATLGTIADIVPLIGENRIIIKEGLKAIKESRCIGLKVLKEISGIDEKDLKTGTLLFTLIPRINASGRISDANRVMRLLLTESEDEAIEIASWLNVLNKERQKIEEEIYQQALYQLNEKGIRSVIVLSSEGWHMGVIGIVASRLAEAFYRPTFVISIDGDVAKGSARSIPNFNLFKALTKCSRFLQRFGGHKQAAGFQLIPDNIPIFEEYINKIADETLKEEDFVPLLEIDADIDFFDLNFQLMQELEMLEPFGIGNTEPLMGSKRLDVLYPRIVKDAHLKMKLRQKNQSFDAIGFDMASYLDKIGSSGKVDAVFTLCFNEWEGRRCLQLNLKALRPTQ